MLLAFCLVTTSLWSYGVEATADLLADEMVHVTSAGHLSQSDHTSPDKHGTGKSCNHGCHAQSHLTGAKCSNEAVPLIFQANERIDFLQIIGAPTQPNDGPFRPPRHSFQA
jgi:hypothetical protein